MGSARRPHAYAAVPSQRVAQLAIVSTLFPHLPHRRGRPFGIALATGLVIVLGLSALHLFASATVAAMFVVPVTYLIYLYEVEVYEDEPWIVIGATMVAGAVLGFVFASLTGRPLAQLELTADAGTAFVLAGLAIPIASQVLMLAGPLFLYLVRGRFREPLDGLAFGAASALGFTLASSLATFWPSITGPLVSGGAPLDWAVRLIGAGLLVSLINASTTGLVGAALWLERFGRQRRRRPWQSTTVTALIVAFTLQVALAMLRFAAADLAVQLAILVVAAVGILLFVRVVIHQALLVEGAEHQIGPEMTCPECHRIVPSMAFCPACGAARAAGPKQRRSRPA